MTLHARHGTHGPSELVRLQRMNINLANFAKWVIRSSAFDGSDLDGGDVQRMALELGILAEVKYDPDIHGVNEYSEYVEPGDPWYVFTDEFKSALTSA